MMDIPNFGKGVVRTAWHRHRLATVLQGLSDHDLRDMGVERGMIDDHVAAVFPWPSVGRPLERRIALSLQGCG